MIHAYAALAPNTPLKPFEYEPGPLGPEDVEIAVQYCGICHSDLSMLHNHWQMSAYPLVAGHEVVGRVAAKGERVAHLAVGQTVGLGWFSRSCRSCEFCNDGDFNLCTTNEQTIVGRHGGFADRVRCHAAWATPLPAGISLESAGPLFCGGITVFNPLVQFDVRPTDRVAVIGIGGLGHMALRFLRAWGCEVTAFSSNAAKADEIRAMGAHHIVDSRDANALAKIAGSLDFILSTVNVPLNWEAYMGTLRPRGRLHVVGAVPEPIGVAAFPMIVGQKQLSGSPLGSPNTTRRMLDFCARHQIAPTVELFPIAKVNEAIAHLEAGKARYRVVLQVAK